MTLERLEGALARTPALRAFLSQVRAALEGDVFVVGGFPRDLLAGRTPADLDLAVSADAHDAVERLALALGGSAFPLDAERGVYRVTLPANEAIGYVDVGRVRGDIVADLGERDFTVDAIGLPLWEAGAFGPPVDPFNGAADIASARLKMVSERAFDDDPLRLLRAARLGTELGFAIEPASAAAIRARSERLREPAAERQRDELARIFASPRSVAGLRLIDDLGLLEVLLPEIEAERGVSQPKEHYYDVFEHSFDTVAVLDALLLTDAQFQAGETPPHIDLREDFRAALGWFPLDAYFGETLAGHSRASLTKFAGLYHDVAKPETKGPDKNGRIRFLGHPEIGARTTADVCHRFRFGSRETRFVCLLVEEHLRPTQLASPRTAPSDRAIYRFGRDLGDASPACLVLTLADAAAAIGPRLTPDRWRAHLGYTASVLGRLIEQRAATAPSGRLVTGDTIIEALGLAPGPRIGVLLNAIDEAAATREVTTVEEAVNLARELNESLGEPAGQGAA